MGSYSGALGRLRPSGATVNARMNIERITIKPEVCGGEPTIRGMRITVSHVLEMLARGMTQKDILKIFRISRKPTLMPPWSTLRVMWRIARSGLVIELSG